MPKITPEQRKLMATAAKKRKESYIKLDLGRGWRLEADALCWHVFNTKRPKDVKFFTDIKTVIKFIVNIELRCSNSKSAKELIDLLNEIGRTVKLTEAMIEGV